MRKEPNEESDLILHDDEDDAEDEDEVHDEEDVVPESTGTAVAEAVVASSSVACRSRTRRTLFVPARRVRPASTKTMNCFRADAGPKVRLHRAVAALLRTCRGSSLLPP